MVMDAQLDVVFLHQRFEVIPFGHVLGLNDNHFDAHQFGELEQLAILLLVHRGAIDTERVANQAMLIEHGLFAFRLFDWAVGINMLGDHLQIFDVMLHGEVHYLVKFHVAAGPGLKADPDSGLFGAPRGEWKQKEKHYRGERKETRWFYHSGIMVVWESDSR
jgi:hypothetical protein